MCFNFSITKFQEYIEKYYAAKFADNYAPVYSGIAFNRPLRPVLTQDDPDKIRMYQWSLIPFWIKNYNDAINKTKNNYNARAEGIFTTPSFKYSIINKRCLVPADGFFEYHHNNGVKYPFYICFKDNRLFSFAGIYSLWHDKDNNKEYKTFSIITTTANKLLEKVHNTRKRMPVILSREDEKKWLDASLKEEDKINTFLKPYDDALLTAYPVNKSSYFKNDESSIEKFDYDDLGDIM